MAGPSFHGEVASRVQVPNNKVLRIWVIGIVVQVLRKYMQLGTWTLRVAWGAAVYTAGSKARNNCFNVLCLACEHPY